MNQREQERETADLFNITRQPKAPPAPMPDRIREFGEGFGVVWMLRRVGRWFF